VSLVGTRPLDVHRLFAWLSLAAGDLRSLLRLVAHHTGLPIVIVGAIAAVVSWRAFKRGVRFVFEVMVAAAALFAATRLGWIRW
jgi:hypothetical protein